MNNKETQNERPTEPFTQVPSSVTVRAALQWVDFPTEEITAEVGAECMAALKPVSIDKELVITTCARVLSAEVKRLSQDNEKLAKGGALWGQCSQHFYLLAKDLATALADARSTYGPDKEVRVSAERIEAWDSVLERWQLQNQ